MMTRCRPLRCGQGSHFPSHTLSHFPSHSCHTPPPHLAVITLCHKVTLGTVMHCPCSTLLLSRPPGLPPAQCNSTWHPQSCSATPAAPARWQAAQPAPDSSTNQSTQLAPDGLQRTLIKNTISSVTEPFKCLQHTQQHPAHNCHNCHAAAASVPPAAPQHQSHSWAAAAGERKTLTAGHLPPPQRTTVASASPT